MDKNQKKTVIDSIWDLFSSIKFAVVIFATISLTSVVGTLLEQNADPQKNIVVLSRLFGASAAPTMYTVFDRLGFMDMYHSWWFVTLLLLFASNLIICSIDRLPRILKLVRDPIRPLSTEYLEKMSLRKTVVIKGKSGDLKDQVFSALKGIGFKNAESSEDGTQLYAEKGNFTRLGVYITHLSILIILGGAIIGIYFGFNGFVNLPEGSTTSVAYRDNGNEIPLGFEIRCDNFEVDFYGTSDTPKDYKSWLTVFKNGKEVMKKSIEVNDPLKYEGVTFYQSSYGMIPEAVNNGIFVLRLISNNGSSSEINPRIGDTFTIPGTSVQGRITSFSPALSIDASGRSFTYAQQMQNPAVFIEFSESGKGKYSGWLLKRYPQTWNLPDGNRVEFLEYWGVEYTGMQVRKDPGVSIVYIGCIIMAVGLYITFFMSHRRIWAQITEEGNESRVLIAASANKNRAAFERRIEKLVGALSSGSKGGK